LPEYPEEEMTMLNIFVPQDPEDVTLLMECCEAAEDCCDKIQTDKDKQEEVREMVVVCLMMLFCQEPCPPTWDGWQCWSEGQPGKTSTEICPDYIFFFTHGGHQVGCDSKYIFFLF
jgi:hypothetical protein